MKIYKARLRCLPSHIDIDLINSNNALYCFNCSTGIMCGTSTDAWGKMELWLVSHFSLVEVEPDELNELAAWPQYVRVLDKLFITQW